MTIHASSTNFNRAERANHAYTAFKALQQHREQLREQNKATIFDIFKQSQEDYVKQRVSAVIAKYKAGYKLSFDELELLREHAPEAYQEAIAVMRRREELEQQMRAARTKEQVEAIYTSSLLAFGASKSSSKSDVDKKIVISKQFTDAYEAYKGTNEYKKKPDFEERSVKGKNRNKRKFDIFDNFNEDDE